MAADAAVVPESVVASTLEHFRVRQQKRIEHLEQARDRKILPQMGDEALVPESVKKGIEAMAARDTKKRLPAGADMMTVRLPEGLLERTKIRAIKEKATLQSLVAAALENYLKQPLR
jgi:hypothetical protein